MTSLHMFSDKERLYNCSTTPSWTSRLCSNSFGQSLPAGQAYCGHSGGLFPFQMDAINYHSREYQESPASTCSPAYSPQPAHSALTNSYQSKAPLDFGPFPSYSMAAAAAVSWPPHLHPHANQTYNHDIQVELEEPALWEKFSDLGTEMIITKSGRRMFPTLKVRVSNLDQARRYCVYLTMEVVDDCRYKYQQNRWLAVGKAEPNPAHRYFMHPDSPATGAHWMKQPVSFIRLKLSNNNMDPHGHIILNSMHRYRPRIYVAEVETSSWVPMRILNYAVFDFCRTEFIAVTAYQNQDITQLKINHNPFAKGFRSSGKRGNKRSCTETDACLKRERVSELTEIEKRDGLADI